VRQRLLPYVPVVLLICGCAAGQPLPSVSPSPTPGRAPASAEPSLSSTSPSTSVSLPKTLDRIWVLDSEHKDASEGVVRAVNTLVPGANLDGALYRRADGVPGNGILFVFVGKRMVSTPKALYALGAEEKQRRLARNTVCGQSLDGAKRNFACVTETSPSVLVALWTVRSGSVPPVKFGVKELANLAASTQAALN
jgi:hypothetical protein